MFKAYKYRIYPNKKQKELIGKTFGCCRFVYNYFLSKAIKDYEQNNLRYNYYDACGIMVGLKKDPEYEWLKEPDKCALQNALKDLENAYKMFFNGNGFPKFKSKKSHKYSYRTQNYNKGTAIQVIQGRIKLPKLGWVKYRDKYVPRGKIINATVLQVPSGKYYVSIHCTDVFLELPNKTNKHIGIDLGIKEFAITSNGTKYDNPKYLNHSLNKLAKLQRNLARKTSGGANWNKARLKLARQYERISNQRKDFLQKLTTELVRNYDVICIEDLNIQSMIDNGSTIMCRNISDVSWYEFKRELQYKADWHDKKIILVDRYFASSQICHCCGHKFPITKDLSVRTWECPNCGITLDRDVNAAINILNEGLKQIS